MWNNLLIFFHFFLLCENSYSFDKLDLPGHLGFLGVNTSAQTSIFAFTQAGAIKWCYEWSQPHILTGEGWGHRDNSFQKKMQDSVQGVASLQSGLTAQRNLFASLYCMIPFSPISFSFTYLSSLQHYMATWSMAAGFPHRPWDDFKMSWLSSRYLFWGENEHLSDPSKI